MPKTTWTHHKVVALRSHDQFCLSTANVEADDVFTSQLNIWPRWQTLHKYTLLNLGFRRACLRISSAFGMWKQRLNQRLEELRDRAYV